MIYQINNFKFQINNYNNLLIPNNLQKFQTDDNQYDYVYDLYLVNEIVVEEKNFILNKHDIKISINGNIHKRYLYLPYNNNPYAVSIQDTMNHTTIYYHQDYLKYTISDTIFGSLLSLEKRMYSYNQYILHSNYILYHDKAILFTAPSGVGKSTQGELWQRYRNVRIINGDRTLLSKDNSQYYANGWPICGSSEICFNEGYPLGCIVIIDRGIHNRIEDIQYKDKFKRLLGEITINYHNADFVNKAMDFIDDLIQNVKIYYLYCNISEDAVICLENQLIKDGLI
ncbi:MAG: hypothetical protein LUH02_07935 [Erysipelotrichaceae bacterium]|nr:hypothetical protein [Erysipelotrichaceae bacterium]